MEYRKLGRTGLEVSLIGLGTMTWGRQNSEAEGHGQMDYALERGVNFFDTAEVYAVPPNPDTYGKTERFIGTWFASRKNRDKVILASKVAGPNMMPWVRNGTARIDRKNIVIAVEGSLRRLQTDYIDLYQLHWPNRPYYHFAGHWNCPSGPVDKKALEENFLEVLETLGELVREGKIRHAGLSNETAWGTMQYLQLAEKHGLPRMASIQNEYSLLCRLFDWDFAEVARAEEIGLLAWSPLTGGMISGKYLGGKRPEGTRWSLEDRKIFRDTPQANAAVNEYMKLAEQHGLDVCQMALAFVNARPFVTSTLIGATNMEQLKTNIDSVDLKLPPEIAGEIDRIWKDYTIPY